MNTIIALKGKGNSGKSTTIRMLHELLQHNGYQLVRTELSGLVGDFVAVFKKKGKLIGITSSGDKYDLVRDKLNNLINSGCEICICACRSYDRGAHGTLAALDSFTNYKKMFIKKTIAPMPAQEQTVNESDAQRLLSAIENII